jgi:hypothetical protein
VSFPPSGSAHVKLTANATNHSLARKRTIRVLASDRFDRSIVTASVHNKDTTRTKLYEDTTSQAGAEKLEEIASNQELYTPSKAEYFAHTSPC